MNAQDVLKQKNLTLLEGLSEEEQTKVYIGALDLLQKDPTDEFGKEVVRRLGYTLDTLPPDVLFQIASKLDVQEDVLKMFSTSKKIHEHQKDMVLDEVDVPS